MAHGCCWDPTSPSAEQGGVAGVPWCFYPTIPAPAPGKCSAVTEAARLDCHPEPNASPSSCTARGCCWDAAAAVASPADGQLRGIAACFFPWTPGLAPAGPPTTTALGFNQTLVWGDADRRGPYGNDPDEVHVAVEYETNTRLRVRMTNPADPDAWDVTPLVRAAPAATRRAPSPLLQAATTETTGAPWGLVVTRPNADGSAADVIFDSTPGAAFGGAVFERQFIELSTALGPNEKLYGLGEHVTPLQLDANSTDGAGQTYTIFSRDRGTPDHAAHGATNLYGQHPVLYRLDPSTGRASAMVLLSSNAMDVVVRPGALTIRVIGGIVDLYLLAGPSPVEVAEQYAELVGKPGMPPYFALGFHLCRWGYDNATYFDSIVKGMAAADMPIDAYWHDIDLFEEHRDFTMDPVRFGEAQMGPIIDGLIEGGVRFGGIVDPAIQCNLAPGQYDVLDSGTAADVWVRNAAGDGYAAKGVWPGPTWFPDWIKPSTQGWWTEQLRTFRNVTRWGFIWLDMNEPAIISDDDGCTVPQSALPLPPQPAAGSAAAADAAAEAAVAAAGAAAPAASGGVRGAGRSGAAGPVSGPGFDPEYPPYLPGRFGGETRLDEKTIPMDSQQVTGPHYDVHSLYGITETRVTAAAMVSVTNERPLIISRSSFPSHSRTGAGHWLGDNTATWHDMAMNVAGVMQFAAFFQVPLVGADTCGFNGPTNEELCTRWMGLSATMAPFYRNHNSIGMPEQAPFVFSAKAQASMRFHMRQRMALLPMWAAAFQRAAARGTPVVRPLWFDWPSAASAGGVDLSAEGTQAIVGPGMMAAPVLEQGATNRSIVFPPAGAWFDWYTGAVVPGTVASNVTRTRVWQSSTYDPSPLFVRAGVALPVQGVARNSTFARKLPFGFAAFLDPTSGFTASGTAFWDDGVSTDSLMTGTYTLTAIKVTSSADGSGSAVVTPSASGAASPPLLGQLTVAGAQGLKPGAPVKATINGQTATATVDGEFLRIDAGSNAVSLNAAMLIEWTA
ncbi:hypothetical protein FNF29_05285 [Cafeteria roenbergensis]|uniref:Maltase n=1 Tax=Cafeteria roenbergensis TaxID=33653 RepID=A0A5A8CBK8_CAFRO|nr:hypothetical protein FNF29_05285 [Cafeteria roenbergensis]|eukprot:KAA0150482.1 hypothetical protein FNF29_05285 [Cafeteria roenbergensis]